MNDILQTYNVSRETIEQLKNYQNLVLEENEHINLISKSSAEDIWNRHVVDSLQLISFINKEHQNLYDFGSGAGFPGIVLAIVAKEKYPSMKITLIESIAKKTNFLNKMVKQLNLTNTAIICERIEKVKLVPADIITSRALASLDKLLSYAKPFLKTKSIMVFPKGEKWQEEINLAKQNWNFEYEAFLSKTNQNSRILCIKNVGRK